MLTLVDVAARAHTIHRLDILTSVVSSCQANDDSCSKLIPTMTKVSVSQGLDKIENLFSPIVPVVSTAGLHFLLMSPSGVLVSPHFLPISNSTLVARFGRLIYVATSA